MTPDTEFEQLMTDSAAHVADLRESLRRMQPQLIEARDCYAAYIALIEQNPGTLFSVHPPCPGGFARLGPADEQACANAVLRVLRQRLAKALKVILPESPATETALARAIRLSGPTRPTERQGFA